MEDKDDEVAEQWAKWHFTGKGVKSVNRASTISVRGIINTLMDNLNHDDDTRLVVLFGYGDPSMFPTFRTCVEAENAIVDTLRTAKYSCYYNTRCSSGQEVCICLWHPSFPQVNFFLFLLFIYFKFVCLYNVFWWKMALSTLLWRTFFNNIFTYFF